MAFLPKHITIYSVGLLGGSLGLALKTSGYTGKITGLSSAPSIETALALGCIDDGFGYDQLAAVVRTTDLLILCSPINVIIRTIGQLGKIDLPAGLVVTDVGSTKGSILETARRELPPNVRFIGGHPMTGSEKSGAAASDPYLFQNAIYVLARDDRGDDLPDRMAAFLTTYLGCRSMVLDAAVHDTIAAAVSHIPHLLAVALVNLAADVERRIPGTLQLAAGGFRDMTRIASSPYAIWHDILATNKQATAPLLDALIASLTAMKAKLERDGLGPDFESAQNTRRSIPASTKGFIHQLADVLVHAKDQPGFIAAIAQALSAEQVNIKDIELLKVREGEGGTIRLAFEDTAVARQAVTILNERGFSARERT
jgi:prephenate dehydrogenase